MSYRNRLPQLDGGVFLTDGGIETVLIFHEGLDLPAFAAFDLLKTDEGTTALRRYYEPQDDGYQPSEALSADAARDYHVTQIATFADTAADMITALTMTYADEAIGISRAASDAEIPVAISFTLETDGRLPSGQTLGDAIQQLDDDAAAAPAYYMINCTHPTHFETTLASGAAWTERIRGLRANASTKSHAELDEATELDAGDPADLGARYVDLRAKLPRLNVLGGCCGTDHRHVAAISSAWLADP
jgi:homocysteine S-methyltransferase